MRWIVVAGLFALFVPAWGQQTPLPAPEPEKRRQQPAEAKEVDEPKAEKPAMPSSGAPVDPSKYVIGAEDILFIKVWREQELTGFYAVRPDGKISLPLAGDIEAVGTTPDQLKQRVVTALQVVMNQPEVMLEVRQVNSKRYYISGEVNKSGPYSLVAPVTVLEALSMAGGLREWANPKKIVIMRKGERLKFNYKEVLKGKNMDQNVTLEPGDHIIVP